MFSDINGDCFYHLLLMVLLGEQNHIHGIFIRLILAQFKIFYDLCGRNDSRWGMWAGMSAFHPNKNLSKT